MADLRDKILPCAVDLYLEQGLKGLSMRHIAENLGVSATAIYRHYRNKEDLLHGIIGEAVKVFAGYLAVALTGQTPKERFQLSNQAYLNFGLEQSKYYEVIFLAPDQLGHGSHPEELRRQHMGTFQFLVDRVQECMASGCMRKEDPFAVAMTIWAHCHGLVSIYLAKKWPIDEPTFRNIFAESVNRLNRGLRADLEPAEPSPKGKR